MRHAPSQAADGLHFLRLKKLLLQLRLFRLRPLPLRDVACKCSDIERGAVVVADLKQGAFDVDRLARSQVPYTRFTGPVSAAEGCA